MAMTHNLVARALELGDEVYTYHDYLYELCADGYGKNPVSEQQWKIICDMQGKRRLMYASNTKHVLAGKERNR
jgi:hypothetical protein